MVVPCPPLAVWGTVELRLHDVTPMTINPQSIVPWKPVTKKTREQNGVIVQFQIIYRSGGNSDISVKPYLLSTSGLGRKYDE